MADKPRTVRLSDEEWAQVEALAERTGTTRARAVAQAVAAALGTQAAYRPHTGENTDRIHVACTPHTAPDEPREAPRDAAVEDGAAVAALVAQLAEKDAQIARLMAQCEAKDAAIAQALDRSQQLHAMEKARPSLGQRVRALFSK